MNTLIKLIFSVALTVLLNACATTNVSSYFSSDQYVVQPGDTLTTIAFRYKMPVSNLLKWNKLSANSIIKPGQKIFVKIPNKDESYQVVVAKPQTKPFVKPVKKWKPKPIVQKQLSYKNKYNWVWPVVNKYDTTKKRKILKGLSFNGKQGSNVVASSAGTVIYSGSGLKKYGNLVIIKHSSKLLTAYAFNKKNLVKENDKVKKGQLIATMGTKNKKGHLYFEVRKNGKPTNPLYYLKPR